MIKKITLIAFLICLLTIPTISAQPQKPVTIKADTITYDTTTGISTATGNVVINQDGGQATANYAEYNTTMQSGFLSGNVVIIKDDAKIYASEVYLRTKDHMTAVGNAKVIKAGDSITAPQIDYWTQTEFAKTSGGWAMLAQADGSTLSADYIEYNVKTGQGLGEKNVKINAPARNLTGAGDKATYIADNSDKKGEFILTGNAWVIQDGNKIIGNELIVKSDSSTSQAKGNVRVDLQTKTVEQTDKK